MEPVERMSPEATLLMTSFANFPPESSDRVNMAPPRLVWRRAEVWETVLAAVDVWESRCRWVLV